jgi:hypothetical protein
MRIRQKLLEKIKKDCGIEISKESLFFRPTLTWQHKSAGRFIWYFYSVDSNDKYYGKQIGSAEKMSELLRSEKIVCNFGASNWGFYELSSS